MRRLCIHGGLLAIAMLLALAACGGTPVDDQSIRSSSALLTINDLQQLPAGYRYELWLFDQQTGPTALTRFNADANGSFNGEVQFDSRRIEPGMEVEVSIEPEAGDFPGQSQQKLLSGFLSFATGAGLSATRALNIQPSVARIQYILETPSTAAADDYARGLYWCVPGSFFGLPDPIVPLPQPDVVPTLPVGWVYEGWVIENGTPISTGRFPTVGVPDSDGVGPAAGPLPALPFPGQEYIDPPKELPGKGLWLSIEPEPDYSPAPSGIILLERDAIPDQGPVTQQHMAGAEGDTGPLPSGSISFIQK